MVFWDVYGDLGHPVRTTITEMGPIRPMKTSVRAFLVEPLSVAVHAVRNLARVGFGAAAAALDLARQDQANAVIRAPIAGVVGARQAQPGDYVQAGSRLMTLVPTAGSRATLVTERVWVLAGHPRQPGNTPAVGLDGPLRAAGDLALEPKQAWTNVADFTSRGIDAVNFGPGAPAFAHRRDEQVEISALVHCYETLRRFVAG